MIHTIREVRGHYEAFDYSGKCICSGDTMQEVEQAWIDGQYEDRRYNRSIKCD